MRNYLGKVARGVGFFAGLFLILWISSDYFKPESATYNIVLVDQKESDLRNEEENTIDVIFAGDSECYSAFSPVQMWQEYGFTSFLCATSAQRLCDTYRLLETAFETQSPKVVVVNTNCMYRSASDEKKSDDKYIKALGEYVPVFRYHSRWKTFMSQNILNEDAIENQNEDQKLKGFRVRKSTKSYEGGEYMKETDKKKEISALALDYMEKIKALCEENDCELILVSIPSAKNWNYEKHNAVEEWANAQELTYVDLNLHLEEMGVDWKEDTKDKGDHLNFDGAKKVSTYFGKYLSETYALEDHRTDEEYQEWNDNTELLKD